MIATLLTIIFVIVCLLLCVAILLQSSKGGLGAGLGGGGSQSTQVFGGQGPGGMLIKATAILSGLFMVLSLFLAYFSSQSQSLLGDIEEEEYVTVDEDEVLEEGTLDVNADGTPIGSAPAPVKAPTPVKAPAPVKTPEPVKEAPAADKPAGDAPAGEKPAEGAATP